MDKFKDKIREHLYKDKMSIFKNTEDGYYEGLEVIKELEEIPIYFPENSLVSISSIIPNISIWLPNTTTVAEFNNILEVLISWKIPFKNIGSGSDITIQFDIKDRQVYVRFKYSDKCEIEVIEKEVTKIEKTIVYHGLCAELKNKIDNESRKLSQV